MSDEWHESESYLQLSRTQAQFVARSERASERASHACVRMRQLSLARAHSIKRRSRGFFLELTHDALPALHSVRTHDRFCIRVFSAWDGPSRLCFHFLDGPDCGGWGGREIAESLTGVEHDPKCGFVAFQRSRLWEGDLQNP